MTSLTWKAEALVLVVEHRTCTHCGSTFTTPGDLKVRMEARLGGYRRTWYIPPKDVQLKSFLPHERKDVNTEIQRCRNCFIAVPEQQLTLWPGLFQPHIAFSARIAALEQAEHDRLMNGNAPQTSKMKAKAKEKPLTLADL